MSNRTGHFTLFAANATLGMDKNGSHTLCLLDYQLVYSNEPYPEEKDQTWLDTSLLVISNDPWI